MKRFVVLLLPLLVACTSTKPPSCDGSNKRPINQSAVGVVAPPKTGNGPGPVVMGRWLER